MHPSDEESCATAVFFDNKKSVKRACDFLVRINTIKPTIRHLNEGKYLVANISSLFLRCPTGLTQQPGCQFYVFSVPCLCDISSGSTYFPPRLNHCFSKSDKATAVHPVNLAVLLHLAKYEYGAISDIYGNTTFNEKPAFEIPAMSLFKHNLSDLIANDRETDLILQRIANTIKSDKLVFQTLADPILDQLQFDDDSSMFSWTSVLAVSDTIVIVILSLAMGYLGFRVHTMPQVIAMLSASHKVDGKMVYLFPTSTTTTEMPVIIVKEQDNTICISTLACTFYKCH